MDDVTLIAPPSVFQDAVNYFALLSRNAGLKLNAKKCLLLHKSQSMSLSYKNVIFPFLDFDKDATRLLGAFIGNTEAVKRKLDVCFDDFSDELDQILTLSIPKQLKFTFVRCCYNAKFNHIFRSSAPSVSLQCCQKFHLKRTSFLAELLNLEVGNTPSHAFH
ncbi:hypothetical protein RCL1_001312 [Eukaryota sp. TZLM3-RCL]